jgi:pyroglutamyl-peptidase
LQAVYDWTRMNILLTGFGPFPGAPFNPTGRLVEKLAASRKLARAGVRRAAHVFRTSYETVDRELPLLMAREKPDVLVMFGLASRTRHVCIETRARNARSRTIPDVGGSVADSGTIVLGAATSLELRAPAQRLARAARTAGVDARLSHDAGSYLCNYLCWRATEAAAQPGGPKLAAFVHVPLVGRPGSSRRGPLTFDDLVRAGEAIVLAAMAAARTAC